MSELIGVLDNAIQITGGISVTGQITGVLSAGINTASATAEATDIKAGKTAFVNGVKLTGAMPEYEATTITPGTADQIIQAGRYLAGDQTIKGDADLLPQNIKNGTNIFGVDGSLAAVIQSSIGSTAASLSVSSSMTVATGNPSKNNGLLSFTACLYQYSAAVFLDYWVLSWTGTEYVASRRAGGQASQKITNITYNPTLGTVTVGFNQNLSSSYRLAYTYTSATASLG